MPLRLTRVISPIPWVLSPLCHQDPFGQRLKKIMAQIQEHMEMPELPQNFGTQVYEQRIVELENRGEELAQVRVLGG